MSPRLRIEAAQLIGQLVYPVFERPKDKKGAKQRQNIFAFGEVSIDGIAKKGMILLKDNFKRAENNHMLKEACLNALYNLSEEK